MIPDSSSADLDRLDRERRSFGPFVAMIVTIVVAMVAGPPIVAAVAERLERADVTSLGPAEIAPADSDDDVVAQAPAAADDPAPATTPTAPTTAVGTTDVSAPPTALLGEPVREIRLVPALRDVIVRIDGVDVASDEQGVVQVPLSADGADVEFVGLRAQPALRVVAFGSWSDGDNRAERSLAELDGPTVQMGLVISNRVTVTARDSVPEGSEIVFESDAGSVRLTAGRTAWVPASRAVDTGAGFEEQFLSYTARSLVTPDTVVDLAGASFEATPEALWVVPTSATGSSG